MPPSEALQIARDQGTDLIEIAPMANPPVCKIIDWSKFKYEYSKKQKSTKQHTTELKEMWFKPRTDVGDLEHKVKKIRNFLEEKHKVKITVKPSPSDRRLSKTFYFDLIAKVLDLLAEDAEVETPAKEEGRNVFTIIKPKK